MRGSDVDHRVVDQVTTSFFHVLKWNVWGLSKVNIPGLFRCKVHYHFSVRIGSFQVIAICRYFLKKEIAGFQFFLNSGHKCPFLKKMCSILWKNPNVCTFEFYWDNSWWCGHANLYYIEKRNRINMIFSVFPKKPSFLDHRYLEKLTHGKNCKFFNWHFHKKQFR